MITLDLPFPPARSDPRRVDAAWREAAGFDIQLARPGKIAGAVRVDIRLEERRADLNTCANALLDLLVIHGVIQNRAALHELRLRRDRRIAGVRVSVRPIPDPE